jgi:hypothetical protein
MVAQPLWVASIIKPGSDLGRVEADQPPNLQVRPRESREHRRLRSLTERIFLPITRAWRLS